MLPSNSTIEYHFSIASMNPLKLKILVKIYLR